MCYLFNNGSPDPSGREDGLADEQTFEVLLGEFRRVGVDPDTFSAMLALRPEDALRALRLLPDGAGPSAFLSQLRKNGIAVSGAQASSGRDRLLRPRDKSA
jgi:hypothetical protein